MHLETCNRMAIYFQKQEFDKVGIIFDCLQAIEPFQDIRDRLFITLHSGLTQISFLFPSPPGSLCQQRYRHVSMLLSLRLNKVKATTMKRGGKVGDRDVARSLKEL
jgi:hypothetical protein